MRQMFLFLKFLGVLFVGLLALPHDVFAVRTLTLANTGAETSVQGLAAKTFKQYVEEKTKGNFSIQLLFSSSYGTELKSIEAVRAGTLDASVVPVGSLVYFAKGFGILTLPYVFENTQEATTATTGKSAEIMNEYAVKAGFRVLAWVHGGFCHMSNAKHPVKSLENAKGLKIATTQSAVILAAYKGLSMSPVPMPVAQRTSALQQGRVDGQCSGYSDFAVNKLYSARQKYITETHYFYQLHPLIISERVFEQLLPQEQKILQEAGLAAQEAVLQFLDAQTAKINATLVQQGVEIATLKDAPTWKRIAREKVWPEFADFLGGKKAINEYLKSVGKAAWK